MASLYVDRRDVHLQHDAGAIAFYENGQRSATVPLAPGQEQQANAVLAQVAQQAGLQRDLAARTTTPPAAWPKPA